MGKKSATLAYESSKSQKEYLDEAMEHFSKLVGYPVHIDRNNSAAYLYEALKYMNWLKTCPSCGHKTRPVPVELRQGISALYGANMGPMKAT